MCVCSHSVVSDSCATPWTVAHQAPLSMGFSRQEYWRGMPFPPSAELPDPGIEPESPELTGGFFTTIIPRKQIKFTSKWKVISIPKFYKMRISKYFRQSKWSKQIFIILPLLKINALPIDNFIYLNESIPVLTKNRGKKCDRDIS